MLKHDGMLAQQHNAMNETPLIISAQKDYPNIVLALLEHGANPQAIDHNGRTAMSYAQECGHHEIVHMLETIDETPPSQLLLRLLNDIKS